jgi:L-seryl-tRNA(Ser) seleniumtransferase
MPAVDPAASFGALSSTLGVRQVEVSMSVLRDRDVSVPLAGFTRRRLFRLAGLLGLGGLLPGSRAAEAVQAAASASTSSAKAVAAGQGLYEAIGVRPLINCRGTLTIIGGSMELPEVRAAKDRANQQYVQLDELMDAIGKRLAELTGAEWGVVTAGCAAAMSHATAACVAGGNPDLHVRIPDLRGFPKDEVIIPGHSRNVYDAAIRAVGVKIVEANTPDELRLAIGPKTAMIYVFANARNESGPMSLEAIASIAREHNVPVMVDAAAEILTVPSIHLQRGATLVGYSGGKIIRGPQSAGLLLGRKDLVKAAWIHSAPHHGYSRAMKVGREEMVGMLVAVESWVRRDHAAEWAQWVARCDHIAERVSHIPGVTPVVRREPGESRSNRSPRLMVRWDTARLGISGEDVADLLYNGEPRIALGGGGARSDEQLPGDTGISIGASMMGPGDEKVVADRVHEVLSANYAMKQVEPPKPPVADLSGQWRVEITYAASKATHALHLQQKGNDLLGTHQGDFVSRDVAGSISGDAVSLASRVTERAGYSLNYRFSGQLAGDVLSGALDLGEYRAATWTARRHVYGPPLGSA